MRRGEITSRADVSFWRYGPLLQQRLKAARYPLASLHSLVSVEAEYGSGARAIERLSPSQPRYIRITDFGADGIEPQHEFAAPDAVDESCWLEENDILFARSGATVGKTYLHEDTSEPAIFAGYCIRFRVAPSHALPRFVYWFSKTRVYELWVLATQRPAGQPNINKEEYKTLQLPLPKDLSTQAALTAAMDAAREKRRMKLAEADALLAGLDGFLLATLGLTPPLKDDRKVFACSVREAREQSHLNADYYHPERILALRAIDAASKRVPNMRLAEVVTFIRDQIKTPGPNYLSLAHVQSHTGELTNSNEEAAGACSEYRTGDVLFARLRPYLNKVYRAEMDGCCSPEFHVLRVKDASELLPDYLSAILRSSLTLAQTRHMMTGNTHPRLTNEDVVNLVVPIPKDLAAQKAVAAEARRRREEARRLRAEAEGAWQAAKRWFEEQLLGPMQS